MILTLTANEVDGESLTNKGLLTKGLSASKFSKG